MNPGQAMESNFHPWPQGKGSSSSKDCRVVSPWCLLSLLCRPYALQTGMFGGGVFASSNQMKSCEGCVIAWQNIFLVRPQGHMSQFCCVFFCKVFTWSQTWCSLIHATSWSGNWHGWSPKSTQIFVLEETACLPVKASQESTNVCVDS